MRWILSPFQLNQMLTPSAENAPSKMDVVVLALDDAGGRREAIDTEDVAIKAWQLAPKAFCWRKYESQVDISTVRLTLRHAAEARNGARVGGSMRAGWHLTPAGLRWLEREGPGVRRLLGFTSPTSRGEGRAETRHQAIEIQRLTRSDAYRLWKAGLPIDPKQAATAFRIDGYTSDRDRSLKSTRFIELAAASGDAELQRFVEEMAGVASEYRPAVMKMASEEGRE
jgi:hypothetical protein